MTECQLNIETQKANFSSPQRDGVHRWALYTISISHICGICKQTLEKNETYKNIKPLFNETQHISLHITKQLRLLRDSVVKQITLFTSPTPIMYLSEKKYIRQCVTAARLEKYKV